MLVPLSMVAIVAAVVLMLTERKAAKISPGLRMWSGSATEYIARPPDQVWAFIRPADTAPAIQPQVRRAFRVPGTPDGPGEQQCFITDQTFQTVDAASLWASLASSPWMRRYPQWGFSVANRMIRRRISGSIGGRPVVGVGGWVQCRATRRRCHRSTVSGRTIGNVAPLLERSTPELRRARVVRSVSLKRGRAT